MALSLHALTQNSHLAGVLGLVGTFGSGKTTTAYHTLRDLHDQGTRCAYIINDAAGGQGGMLDGEAAAKFATMAPVASGCFTCSSPADARKLIAELSTDHDYVLIEVMGLVPGTEMRDILKSIPNRSVLIGLLDGQHLEQNEVRYGDIVQSHMVADRVYVTRVPEGEDLPDTVAAYTHGKRVEILPLGQGLAVERLFAALDSRPRPLAHVCGHGCGHDHAHAAAGHGHTHAHGAGHDHDHAHLTLVTYQFGLVSGVTLDQIQQVFTGELCDRHLIERVKGSVAGSSFGMIHGSWTRGVATDEQLLTIYALEEVDWSGVAGFSTLTLPPRAQISGESTDLIRTTRISPEATLAEIQRLRVEVESQVVVQAATDSGVWIDTHPENLQILKEISRRANLPEETFAVSMAVCMGYWARAAQAVLDQQSRIDPACYVVNIRELGISLAWWWERFGPTFGPDLRQRVQGIPVVSMVAQGYLGLTELNSDAERAWWQAEEFRVAVGALDRSTEDSELAHRAAVHALSLASTESLQRQWQSIVDHLG